MKFINQSLNIPTRSSLAANITLFLFLVMLMNFLIFSYGWDERSDAAALKQPYVDLPEFLIPSVWVLLISLLAYVRWSLNKYANLQAKFSRKLITIILFLCITYTFYAIAIKGILGIYSGLVGNLVILLLLIYDIIFNFKFEFRNLNWYLYPVVAWIVFATTLIMSELAWF